MKRLLVLTLLFVSAQVYADDAYWTSGLTITGIEVADAENFYYRAYGVPSCGFAYVNESDSGSKAKIATLLAAYSMGKTVSLFIQPTNGYCHIRGIYMLN